MGSFVLRLLPLIVVLAFPLASMAQVSLNFTRTPEMPCYESGDAFTVTVTISGTFDAPGNPRPRVTALSLVERFPDTWTVVNVSGTNPPRSQLDPNGETRFFWTTVPAPPVTFSYTLSVPPAFHGDTEIEGELHYRILNSVGLQGPTSQLDLCELDDMPPLLTLVGPATLNAECGEPFEDPGAVAVDNFDGNLDGAIVVTGVVNPNQTGNYVLLYDVTDEAGNEAVRLRRTVRVRDTAPPQLTLLGAENDQISCGQTYTDPGVLVSDSCDDLPLIQVEGAVDVSRSGVYELTYQSIDAAGNAAEPVTRTVTVSDVEAPIITILGNVTTVVPCSTPFVDPGVQVEDACEGLVTPVTSGAVDVNTPGDYIVTYTAQDSSGNTAVARRTIQVRDSLGPIISLNGSQALQLECGAPYEEAGALAGNCRGAVEVTTSGVVDVNTPGQYVVVYSADDGEQTAVATRTVTVVDTTPPEITLLGDGLLILNCGATFVEPGVEAIDRCEGELAVSSDAESVVDTSAASTFEITYTAEDASGNIGVATRQVRVAGPACGGPLPVCDIAGLELLEPRGILYLPTGAADSPQLIRSTVLRSSFAECTAGAASVNYLIDGALQFESSDEVNGFAIEPVLAPGTHTVEAEVTSLVSDDTYADEFSVIVREREDSDRNGYPDGPFAVLEQDGDRWSAPRQAVAELSQVGLVSWLGSCDPSEVMAPLNALVPLPDSPGRSVLVEVPRELLACGEHAILSVMAGAAADTLLGEAEAGQLADLPADLMPLGFYFDISIAVSTGEGQEFREVTDTEAAEFPITIQVNGLSADELEGLTVESHPTILAEGLTNDFDLLAGAGAWSDANIALVELGEDYARFELTGLSLFGVFGPVEPGVKTPASCAPSEAQQKTWPGDVLLFAGLFLLLVMGARWRSRNRREDAPMDSE
ncbi:MAG: DUF5011 domain-containing protein [Candidatus Hydrogenedentes bacterium]|nr:DUF5011 domain-containing protein [Candidatus Hydrogenedentota bacterium]